MPPSHCLGPAPWLFFEFPTLYPLFPYGLRIATTSRQPKNRVKNNVKNENQRQKNQTNSNQNDGGGRPPFSLTLDISQKRANPPRWGGPTFRVTIEPCTEMRGPPSPEGLPGLCPPRQVRSGQARRSLDAAPSGVLQIRRWTLLTPVGGATSKATSTATSNATSRRLSVALRFLRLLQLA
jgi:hypothetical protein